MASSESTVSNYWTEIEGGGKYAPYSGEDMGLGYDIFRESSDGPLWVAQAATLAEAREKLETLAGSAPAEYFVRDATSAKIVGRLGPEKAGSDTSERAGS